MASSYLEFAQYWLTRLFLGLGGMAGMAKIYEWLTKHPKIIGEIEAKIFADETSPEGKFVRGNLFLQVYLVNARVQPTTVRSFSVSVKIPGGTWKAGSTVAIPDGFSMPMSPMIDFPSARLYDKAGTDTLEYGKGIRGWLRIGFPDLHSDEFRKADIKIEIMDAFNKKHVIKSKFIPGKPQIGYFPGAGIKQA